MSEISAIDQEAAVGTEFVSALTARDFERLQACFHPGVKFRALVPSGVREGSSAAEATGWLRKWFGNVDELDLLGSSADRIADRLHISYRFRVREKQDWQLIEQQAYCIVRDGLISAMNLLCSDFRPDPEAPPRQMQSAVGADAFYDAGARSCAEGPLDDVARMMRELASGQTLEVHATDPSVVRDLPAWCRLVGHDLIRQEAHRYVIRHK